MPSRKNTEAELRIGFMQGDGSWSYLGSYALRVGSAKRTMNFGWRLSGARGRDTALHEIGHALGLPHEHQNPYAGIVWNEDVTLSCEPGGTGRSVPGAGLLEERCHADAKTPGPPWTPATPTW